MSASRTWTGSPSVGSAVAALSRSPALPRDRPRPPRRRGRRVGLASLPSCGCSPSFSFGAGASDVGEAAFLGRCLGGDGVFCCDCAFCWGRSFCCCRCFCWGAFLAATEAPSEPDSAAVSRAAGFALRRRRRAAGRSEAAGRGASVASPGSLPPPGSSVGCSTVSAAARAGAAVVRGRARPRPPRRRRRGRVAGLTPSPSAVLREAGAPPASSSRGLALLVSSFNARVLSTLEPWGRPGSGQGRALPGSGREEPWSEAADHQRPVWVSLRSMPATCGRPVPPASSRTGTPSMPW
jgi:hypothetical protein